VALHALDTEDGRLALLAAPAPAVGPHVAPGATELAVEDMRHLIESARGEHDVVVLDLGVLAAGRQSAVGAALAERVLLVTAAGTRRQQLAAARGLLERLAPGRVLLLLNRALAADPLLAPAGGPPGAAAARLAEWLASVTRLIKRRLQHE
jgi:hypothetical protein